MSTQTQWHWNLLPSVILIEILSYLPLSDKISACSTCKAWRSALFHPSFWRKIELVFKSSDWSRLERSRFVASWGARKLRSCVLQLETVNTSCLIEADHVLLKLTRNPQVGVILRLWEGMNLFFRWGETNGIFEVGSGEKWPLLSVGEVCSRSKFRFRSMFGTFKLSLLVRDGEGSHCVGWISHYIFNEWWKERKSAVNVSCYAESSGFSGQKIGPVKTLCRLTYIFLIWALWRV